MKFCPKCGKKTKKLYEGLCSECSAYDVELFQYNPKDITLCISCGTVHDGRKRVKKENKEEAIREILLHRVELNKSLIDPSIDIIFSLPPHHEKQGSKLKVEGGMRLRCKTESGASLDEEYFLPVSLRYITCEKCSKKNTNYYEGILQIRHNDKERIDKVLEHLDKIMEDESKRSVFDTNRTETKKGVDVYITSQKHIKDIGKKLHDIFGGELKINEQLFSRDNLKSKNLYRVNVLLRLPGFEVGGSVFINEKLVYIKKIKGYQMIGRDLIFDKDISINYKDHEVKVVASPSDIKTTTVMRTRPQKEVMNPDTYQSETVRNPESLKSKNMGDKVKVVIWKGLWAI